MEWLSASHAPWRSAWLRGLALIALVWAWPAGANPLSPEVTRFVQTQLDPRWGRAEIKVGDLDTRLNLAPCQQHEPYLLTGSKLWGRTAVGVRCKAGANWAITLPVTVTIHGPAWVADQALAAGTRVQAEQLRQETVELTREPGIPVTALSQLDQRTLTRRLAPGEVLRLEHLKTAVTVQAGEPVRIQLSGAHFQIVSDGVAISPAGEGQTLRVRTESGRLLSGTLRGRTVDVPL